MPPVMAFLVCPNCNSFAAYVIREENGEHTYRRIRQRNGRPVLDSALESATDDDWPDAFCPSCRIDLRADRASVLAAIGRAKRRKRGGLHIPLST
jgi:uncharacterized protein YbaR (Trm112 family)